MIEFLTVPLIPIFLDLINPLNESRPRKINMDADYLLDQNDKYNYIAIAIHHWPVSFAIITLILAVDGIFIVFICHACGQLEILG